MPDGGETDFTFRRLLAPLEAHRDRLLVLSGLDMLSTREGPGDGHQKGMGHVLTGVELLPGDTMGGCDTCPPVSWRARSKPSSPETRTRARSAAARTSCAGGVTPSARRALARSAQARRPDLRGSSWAELGRSAARTSTSALGPIRGCGAGDAAGKVSWATACPRLPAFP